jgi:3',5'-nucleoside bisphosphate phosphatase
MVDLHLHTTASDGRDQPEALVDRVAAAGIRVMSVTDHDTRAAEPAARQAAALRKIEFISGIEITAVYAGKDVHVLAYGLPASAAELDRLLDEQRQRRVARAREIAGRLARLNVPIDVEALVRRAGGPKAIARPQIAGALVAAGHVASIAEAFDRYLDERSPAYVPHCGASPADVVGLIGRSGGVSSLAHPGTLNDDRLIGTLVDAGLHCLEAYHSSHSGAIQAHYVSLARRLALGVTGGSDFHGEGTRRSEMFGIAGLPIEELERFRLLLADAGRNAPSPAA